MHSFYLENHQIRHWKLYKPLKRSIRIVSLSSKYSCFSNTSMRA
jgi:hypothetical protein